ncbi:phage protease [Azorhizobium doebereinerae]|uniref:phage protease n=1 Tax=Azorhizobium doebereinerae TaxID=281091 RepID=UPI000491F789|nr:phage protease [Azorhizobium doebereinerae]
MARHDAHLSPAFAADTLVPERVNLVPAGTFSGVDGRGPHTLADATTVIAASVTAAAKLPIDENYATDLAAPAGEPSPERGWIAAFEAVGGAIWRMVEWTEAGRAPLADPEGMARLEAVAAGKMDLAGIASSASGARARPAVFCATPNGGL